MNNKWLLWGFIGCFLMFLGGCERIFPSKPPKTGAKQEKRGAPPRKGSISQAEPEKPSPELMAEAPPGEAPSAPSAPRPHEEIASLGKESPPRKTFLSAPPREDESIVSLASAETFPAVLKKVVAQFSPHETARLPRGWEVREFTGSARAQVVNVDGVYALHLKSSGTSFSVHKNMELDLRQTPYITWSWKVDKMPPLGDVRHRKSDDQAAQIYVIFPFFPPTIRSKFLGYIWDSNAPKGTVLQNPNFSPAKVIVVESGKVNLGRWITVTRNVYEDYKMIFGTEPPKIGKVAININTNHTQSSAESYFANIFFHSAPTAELK